MTVEERIDLLVQSQEKSERMQEKTQTMLAQIVESIQRLERIALSHEVRIQDTEAALAALEGRNRKPH